MRGAVARTSSWKQSLAAKIPPLGAHACAGCVFVFVCGHLCRHFLCFPRAGERKDGGKVTKETEGETTERQFKQRENR